MNYRYTFIYIIFFGSIFASPVNINDVEKVVRNLYARYSQVASMVDLSITSIDIIKNDTENLIYISPNSGKAVSSSVGNKYHDKLFKLPVFFLNSSKKVDKKIIKDGFQITGFFLNKYLKKNHNRNLPFYRKKILI